MKGRCTWFEITRNLSQLKTLLLLFNCTKNSATPKLTSTASQASCFVVIHVDVGRLHGLVYRHTLYVSCVKKILVQRPAARCLPE